MHHFEKVCFSPVVYMHVCTIPTVSLPFCHVACSGSKEQETALQSALGTDVSLRCFAGLWICIIERPHLPGSLSLCHRL